ncbi:16S rRNA (guanine(527)-N(7))-methyltransferase RsmG [Haloechinothrix sp. LS1_15]|uniref:16S rRNA (guanine(527)-N(7))-methyltransferase RsmG n=1 Tax=Haloechinothrix sp. LS1_15 TaxID=2652248 RepID=UPI0037BFE0F0
MHADAPEVAGRIFEGRMDEAERFVALLHEHGVTRGVIGPRELDRLWDRHIINSALIAELVPKDALVVDAGSGAGLPGIPLALARPDLRITLLDSMARRVQWLQEMVTELGLGRVEVVRARVESSGIVGADVVTARAVAPLGKLARWCLPLLREGGSLLALKGASAAEELERDRNEMAAAGGVDPRIVQCGSDRVDETATVVVVTRRGGGNRGRASRSGRRGRSTRNA